MSLSLHTDGKYIKNSLNEIIYLRGINKHGFEDCPEAVWIDKDDNLFWCVWDEDVIAQNFDAMKSWGINIVRMYDAVENWADDLNGHRAKVKTISTLLSDRDMYLHYGFWNIFIGTGQGVLPYPPHCPENPYIDSIADFVTLWEDVATELEPYPNILLELWNEPSPPTEGDRQIWLDVIEDCIAAIRVITNQIIVVHCCGHDLWFNMDYPDDPNAGATMLWVTDSRVQGTNILYSQHCYGDFFNGAPPDRTYATTYEDVKAALQSCYVDWCVQTANKPLIIGEFGLNLLGLTQQEKLIQFENEAKIFNEWDIHYEGFCWWTGGMLPLLESGANYPPNDTGQILIDSLQGENGGGPKMEKTKLSHKTWKRKSKFF